MKEYVRTRIDSIKREMTPSQKTRVFESIYEVLEQKGYEPFDIAKLITEVLLEKMKMYYGLINENVEIYYKKINQRLENEDDE